MTLPRGWPRTKIELHLIPIGPLRAWGVNTTSISLSEMTSRNREVFAFELNTVRVGKYCASVEPTGLRMPIEFHQNGPRIVHIVVPPPAEVRVTLVDKRTRAPVTNAYLRWATVVSGLPCWLFNTEPSKVVGDYRFLAPLGRIEVAPWADAYFPTREPVLIHAGLNLVRVELERACCVEVVLMDHGTELPWDSRWRLEFAAMRGRGETVYARANRIAVSEPGEYRLTINGLSGYRSIKNRVVALKRRAWIRLPIELERER